MNLSLKSTLFCIIWLVNLLITESYALLELHFKFSYRGACLCFSHCKGHYRRCYRWWGEIQCVCYIQSLNKLIGIKLRNSKNVDTNYNVKLRDDLVLFLVNISSDKRVRNMV